MTDKSKTNNATSPDCSRRNFLKGSLLAAAVPAAGLGTFYAGYTATSPKPLRIGVVGTGDEGQVLLGALNPKLHDLVSIADIRPFNQHRAFYGDVSSDAALAARPGILSVYGWNTETQARKHIKVYTNYRELISNAKNDGVEAIIIGFPLHLHAPAAIYAMRMGLHVLTEKLMGHSVANCKEMARAAADCSKHLATGHQRHYNILYQEASDTIRRGLLGNIHYIRAQWHRNNRPGGDSWQLPMPEELKPTDAQAKKLVSELTALENSLKTASGKDIELITKRIALKQAQIDDKVLGAGGTYQGLELLSAKDYGYLDGEFSGGGTTYSRPAAEELLRWRLWHRTGGGLMVELGSHQLDAASIFLAANRDYYLDSIGSTASRGEKVHPLKVHVSANRNLFQMDREANDHITTLVEFPAPDYNEKSEAGKKRKICVQYSTINGNGFGGYGEVVYGMDGSLVLTQEQDSQLFRSGGSGSSVTAKNDAGALDTQSSGPAQVAVAGAVRQVSRGYKEQLEHWAWCIRVNPENKDPMLQPRCNPKVALVDSVIALVTNIAADKETSVSFNEAWFDPFDDATPETDILGDPAGKINMHRDGYDI